MMTLKAVIKRHPKIYDLVDTLKNRLKIKVGERIPSQETLVDIIGYPKSTLREHLMALECLGYISIQHGKPTRLIKEL